MQFSNRYHVTGPDWASQSQFNTFADLVVADEKICYDSAVTITEVIGYNAGSALPVFSKSYTTAGTMSAAGTENVPADCAAVVRYTTTQRTSKNHPVYLFNYYHHPKQATGGPADTLVTINKSRLDGYATNWCSGYNDGTNTRKRCGPNGAVAQTGASLALISHRDFPR